MYVYYGKTRNGQTRYLVRICVQDRITGEGTGRIYEKRRGTGNMKKDKARGDEWPGW